jgi:hypothetical protein
VSYWKTKSVAAGQQLKHLVAPFFAVIHHEDQPPERPHLLTITDENGSPREVSAPPGQITRWRW